MPRILVIHNPTAGRRRAKTLGKFLSLLEDRMGPVRVEATAYRGHARDIARDAVDVDIIVAAGGDGTVNEVVDGLCARGRGARVRGAGDVEPQESGAALPTVAFLPLGTVNVLALELELPRDPARAVAMIERGNVLRVRPGVANGRRFLLMASVGLDARAVAAVTPTLKRWFGKFAYVLGAISAMRAPPPSYQVNVDGVRCEGRMVIVARAQCYAGPFHLTPGGGLRTSELSVVIFKSHGFIAALGYGVALARGCLHRLQDIEIMTGAKIEITGPVYDLKDEPKGELRDEPVQIDGDIAKKLPLSITLDDRTVRFLTP